MFIPTAAFKEKQIVHYRRALEPHRPMLAVIENVLTDDKYGIRTQEDQRYCVVKAERLSSVESLADESEFVDPEPADVGARETAPAVEPVNFHVGQRVMYDVGTYHYLGGPNEPVPATVVKIAKQKIWITVDGITGNLWVFPRKLTPLPEDAAASDLPTIPAPPLYEVETRMRLGREDDLSPRMVNLTHSAITGICTVCGCQYDKIFETAELDDPQWGIFIYWSAFSNPCPVCKTLLADHDTEEIPVVLAVLNDADFIDPPTVNHPDQYDEDDCSAADYGEDPDEIAAFEAPLHHELLVEDIDPFDHPAVATRMAELNQRLDDMIAAIYAAESRAEAAEDKALQFQLHVLELVRKIPTPPQPALDQADRDRLEFLCQRYLRQSFESALKLLRFDDDYAVKYPTFDVMCKSFAQRLVDRSLPILAYNVNTEVAKNNTLYLSLNFGWNTLALFNDRATDIERAFAHTSHHDILHTWRKTDFSYDFNPPVEITMYRDTRGYPKLFKLTETEDES